KTSRNHQPVNVHAPALPPAPALTIISSIFQPRYIIESPEIACIGTTQLFLLPNLLLHTASTIGLQSNLREYGYIANEKIPICPYDRYCLSKNGTDPDANPIGIPWRK